MKRIFTFFLALLMIASALPMASLQVYATEMNETPPAETQGQVPLTENTESAPGLSGTFGTNLAWVLDDSGTLTITGTGPMPSWSYEDAPWYTSRDKIKKLVINEGVTSIGSYAFYDCNRLSGVSIPNSVTSISSTAFISCRNLNYNIYDNAYYLGNSENPYILLVVSVDDYIVSCQIPEGTKFIAANAFQDCRQLTSVSIPGTVTTVGGAAFKYCERLPKIVIPEGVTTIGEDIFTGCKQLTSVSIPSTVTSIARYGLPTAAFTSYEQSYYLGNSNNPYHALIQGRSSTSASVTIHKDTKVIASEAFEHTHIKNIVIPEGVTHICSEAFSSGNTESITIPKSVVYIGSNAFEYCRSLWEVHITDVAAWCAVRFNGVSANPLYKGGSTPSGAKLFVDANNTSTQDIVIPEGVEQIANYAFFGGRFQSLTIPSSLKQIGTSAFGHNTIGAIHLSDVASWCSISLANPQINPLYYGPLSTDTLIIPEGITEIAPYAFYNCSATDVSVPASLKRIHKDAFAAVNTSILRIADIAAWCAIELEDITSIPIGKNTVLYLNGAPITTLVIPQGVTSINHHAFYGAAQLTAVSFPASLKTIGAFSFSGTGLTSLTLPGGLTTIEDSAFHNVTGLTSLVLPQGLTTLGGNAFSGCTGLKTVTLPTSLQSIGFGAISGCSSLKEINLPEGFTSIGEQMFSGSTELQTITFPASVTSISSLAFARCPRLENIYFLGAAPTIAEDVFQGNVSVVHCPTSSDAWKEASKSGYGGTLHWLFPGEKFVVTGSAICNHSMAKAPLTWRLEDNTLYVDGDGSYGSIEANWQTYKNMIRKVIVSKGVTGLPIKAFYGHSYLEEATLLGVDYIRNQAFYNCKSLKRVEILGPVTTIGDAAFAHCAALEYVWLPEQLIYIEMNAFWNCDSLKTITMPSKIRRLWHASFGHCDNLEAIYFTGNFPETFRSNFLIDPFEKTPSVKIYYPSGNTGSWTSSRMKTFANYCKNTTMSFHKYKSMSAPKVKGSSQRYPVLTWSAVSGAENYEIYRATSKSGKYTLVAFVEALTWQDMDTTGGKTYYYKVKAGDESVLALNSGYSSVVSVAAKCDAPVIAAENGDSGKPVITWEKVAGAKKYTVYQATSETGKYSKLGTTSKLSYAATKAASGKTYYYKVIANGSKSSYDSSYSNIVSCGVICGAPSVSVKIDSNTGKPSLSWKKVDGAVSYAIFRDGEPLTTVTGVSFKDETAAIDTQYSYQVQALGKTEDLNGSLSKAVSTTSGIAKPAAKGSVDAVSGKPVLTWEAVEGAVKYEIYRSTSSSKSYKLVETVEGLTYTDESVSAGKTYYYKVKAIGAVSKSADSSYVKLTGKCERPTIYADIDKPSGKPKISWEKVAGAKKYEVYRSTNGGSFKKLGTTTKLFYTDTKATIGGEYVYKVKSVGSKSSYNSEYSLSAGMTAICGQPSVKASVDAVTGKPSLTWGKVSGAVRYDIYLVDANGGFSLYASVTTPKFLDDAAKPGYSYSYRVVAIPADEDYYGSLSSVASITATHAAPKAIGKVGDNKKPLISWNEVEGAVKYEIYRSTSKSKGYKVIGESETLTYEDLTAKKGKTYYYKVVAVGNGIQSAQSSYVKVKSK